MVSRIFRQIAHFRAAAGGLGWTTTAVAAARRSGSEFCGRISQSSEREERGSEGEIEREPEGNPAEAL